MPRPPRLALMSLCATAALGAACASRPPSKTSGTAGASAAARASSRVADDDKRGPTSEHPDAIGRLLDAPWGARLDRLRTMSLPLPDAEAWTHVKFFGVTTLAGYRYGDEHHAVAAIFTFPADQDARTKGGVDRCASRFEAWGRERGKAFDILVGEARVDEFAWGKGDVKARAFVLDADRRSLFGNRRYAAVWAVYPAWSDACLVLGMAAAEQDVPDAVRALRDRFVRDAVPALTVKDGVGARALEAKSFD